MGENTLLADGRRARLVCVLSTPHRAWYRIISLDGRSYVRDLGSCGARGCEVCACFFTCASDCHTPGWMTAGALGSRVCSRRRAKQGLESSHGSPRVCARSWGL